MNKNYEYEKGFNFATDVLNEIKSADEYTEEWSKDFTNGYLDGTSWWMNNLKADVGRISYELRLAIRELQTKNREIDKEDADCPDSADCPGFCNT